VSPVDQYIRRATTGLPNRARLDTAAELRVHLNERTRQYMDQGFDRSEAEHLAVEQMGPAEPVNRSFLGHVFTPRVGWVVLVLLVLGSGGWLAANYLFAPAPLVRTVAVEAEELLPYIGDFQMLQVTAPKGTKTLYFAVTQGEEEASLSVINLEYDYADLRPNQRASIRFGVGFLNSALAMIECGSGSRVLATFRGTQSRSEMCLPVPSTNGSWAFLMQNGGDNVMVHDEWQPMLLFRPTVMVTELLPGQFANWSTPEGHAVDAPRDTWFVVSVFATTVPITEDFTVPAYPKVSDVVRQYRWLEPQLPDVRLTGEH